MSAGIESGTLPPFGFTLLMAYPIRFLDLKKRFFSFTIKSPQMKYSRVHAYVPISVLSSRKLCMMIEKLNGK